VERAEVHLVEDRVQLVPVDQEVQAVLAALALQVHQRVQISRVVQLDQGHLLQGRARLLLPQVVGLHRLLEDRRDLVVRELQVHQDEVDRAHLRKVNTQ
jgi:hypothetical protein